MAESINKLALLLNRKKESLKCFPLSHSQTDGCSLTRIKVDVEKDKKHRALSPLSERSLRMVSVKVEFVGTLRGITGKRKHEVMLDEPATIGVLLQRLEESLKLTAGSLVDKESMDPRTSILILVNGKEISVLNGLNTKLEDCASVTLVPVSHGG